MVRRNCMKTVNRMEHLNSIFISNLHWKLMTVLMIKRLVWHWGETILILAIQVHTISHRLRNPSNINKLILSIKSPAILKFYPGKEVTHLKASLKSIRTLGEVSIFRRKKILVICPCKCQVNVAILKQICRLCSKHRSRWTSNKIIHLCPVWKASWRLPIGIHRVSSV